MKKTLLSLAAVAALAFGAQEVKAQSPQRAAIGVVFDGSIGDLWGFNTNNLWAAQTMVRRR